MKALTVVQLSRENSANGGVGSYLLRVCPALQEQGHEVVVIHSDRNSSVSSPGVSGQFFVEDFDRWDDERTQRKRASAVMEILASIGPDIVHIQGNNNFELETEIRGTFPTIKSLHVYDFCPSGNKFHHLQKGACDHATGPMCLLRMGYKRCMLSKRPTVIWSHYKRAAKANENNSGYQKLVVASNYVKEQAVASHYPAHQVEVLPYFTPLPDLSVSARALNRTILFAGRLVREKGLDRLLFALSRVAGSWQLIVAGDGPELSRLKAIAGDLKLEDRVRFVGWTVGERHHELYANASMVVVPSIWPEPFGIVGIEAMSFSKPVVAFRVGGIPEWLEDGVTGYLVEPHDEKQMAEKISHLLENPDEASAMGQRGRLRVEQEFTERRHISRLLGVYQDVVEKYFHRPSLTIEQQRLQPAGHRNA